MSGPITWPESVDESSLDPSIRLLAETYAGHCLTALTLHRVGGNPVTIMPASRERVPGHYAYWDSYENILLGTFYPGTVYPSAEQLQSRETVTALEAIDLPGPVGAVTEVLIDGVALDASAYRVEDGRYLVRLDGKGWPAESGDNFVITYYNSHPVGALGAHAGGVMAVEWLALITGDKKCRLPPSASVVTRQGITMEVTRGMFPEGVTGIPEIDAFLMLWNPFGLRVAPRVYSPDLPAHRQVWHA
jgi:hypothetical protein